MTETRRLQYEGHPAIASAFVQMLQEEGLAVSWEPPIERRGANIPEDVLISILASGTYDALKAGIRAAVEKFRDKFPGRARITDEDDEEDQS